MGTYGMFLEFYILNMTPNVMFKKNCLKNFISLTANLIGTYKIFFEKIITIK